MALTLGIIDRCLSDFYACAKVGIFFAYLMRLCKKWDFELIKSGN